MTWKEIFKTTSTALDKRYFCSCSVPLKLAQLVTILIQQLPTKLLIRFGILSKMDPEAMVMMTRGSTGRNSDWLKATHLLPIHLHECYREYGKGANVYHEFIEKIRLTTT